VWIVRNIINCLGKIKFLVCVREADSNYLLCHICHWLPLYLFPWTRISAIFIKICLYLNIMIKVGKNINLYEGPRVLRLLWLKSYSSYLGYQCSHSSTVIMAELVTTLTIVRTIMITLVTTVTNEPKVIMVTLVRTVTCYQCSSYCCNGYSYAPLSASLCGYFLTCLNVKYVTRGTCTYSSLKGELQNETLLLTRGCIRIK